jgi:hypothetical protein
MYKGNNYYMRINNMEVDDETGRYLNLDLLFATLNQHTEGIYIKSDTVQQGGRKVRKPASAGVKQGGEDKEYWYNDKNTEGEQKEGEGNKTKETSEQ